MYAGAGKRHGRGPGDLLVVHDPSLVRLAVDAGLGELGRLGYLITREFGPRVRLGLSPLDELQLQARCLKRPGYPEDLVGTALYLASDDSAFVTGQMIVHDGGLSFN
jgi:NAD(P)-dependent dehydrogenase (short-subunit alcohol dehydrogenase family)